MEKDDKLKKKYKNFGSIFMIPFIVIDKIIWKYLTEIIIFMSIID